MKDIKKKLSTVLNELKDEAISALPNIKRLQKT